MTSPPPTWQLTLARIEGALPFLSSDLADCLSMASLRRLWRAHVAAYLFDNLGNEHDPGPYAYELMRSWHTEERRQFLSWISRRARPALSKAAKLALAAKGQKEGYTGAYTAADTALARLDALLPTKNPFETLLEWLESLRTEEIAFLEGGSELIQVGGVAITRSAPRGASWAASLAAAMRPHLFALGSAPLALAGLMPRALFREHHETPLPSLLRHALESAAEGVTEDLRIAREAMTLSGARLSNLYASSSARNAWKVIVGLGPSTRAELARGLGITKRTASQSVLALESAGLVTLRQADGAILPASAGLIPRE